LAFVKDWTEVYNKLNFCNIFWNDKNVLIDILAPIDPVGNRNYPFAGIVRQNQPDYNWTRWRLSRDNFS
jgi:hypothetical protein